MRIADSMVDSIIVLIFLLFTVGIVLVFASAMPEVRAAEIDYTTAQADVRLYMDQTVVMSGYTVTIIDFSDTEVLLKITKNDTGAEDVSGAYAVGSVITTKDNALRLLVQNIDQKYTTEKHGDQIIVTGKNPCVTLAFFTPTMPLMDVKITPDKTDYASGDGEIKATLGIVNIGKGDATNVKIALTSEMDQTNGSKTYQVGSISGNSGSVAKTVAWKVPVVEATCTKYANATVTYDDTLHKHYTVAYSCPIQIVREYRISVTKTMTPNCYMGNEVYASVTVKNGGGYDLHNVHLVDFVPAGFKIDDGREQLDTTFNLPMNGYKTIQYTLKPTATGKYDMPAAKLTFQGINGSGYSVTSNAPTVYVDGADVTADRIVTVNQGKAIVTVTCKNVGNVGTTVRMTDELPKNVTLISGKLTNAEYLVPGESTTATYIITFPENTDIVITGRVKFTDVNKRSATIELPDYTIGAQSKQIITKDESPAAIYEKPQVKVTAPIKKPVNNTPIPQNNTVNNTQGSAAQEGPDFFWIGVAVLVMIVIYIMIHSNNK